MSDFAQPAKKLGESNIGNAFAPTGGMGLLLTDDGKMPAGVVIIDTASVARRIAHGNSTVNFAAAAVSAYTTVSHGLGSAHVNVQITGRGSSIFGWEVTDVDATSFKVRAATLDAGTLSGDLPFYWLALG
jgi:hypothetical protein